MRPIVKRLIEDLEALGFSSRPHPTRPDCLIYTHANAPGDELKVYTVGQVMKENAVRIVQRRAHKIAGYGTSGPRDAATLKEEARIKRESAKARRQREQRERDERAANAEKAHQQLKAEQEAARREREIEELMKPGFGREA